MSLRPRSIGYYIRSYPARVFNSGAFQWPSGCGCHVFADAHDLCRTFRVGRHPHADLTNRETSALKQRCDAEEISAKFAALDRDSDGYLILEDLPAEHMLSKLFAEVDFDGDNRLSLAEVAEHDAATDPIE